MSYWPAVVGALGLLSLPFMHWFVLDRGMAVSGRFSALIDRLRFGAPEPEPPPEQRISQVDLMAAVRAMTAAEFGEASVESMPAPSSDSLPAPRTPDTAPIHVLFFAGLALGGALSALLGGTFALTAGLHGALFTQIFGASPLVRTLVLFAGGLLIGAGTRMAGGCTSGHGLCGVSQFQAGSLLATAAFFGAGVALSFALGALL